MQKNNLYGVFKNIDCCRTKRTSIADQSAVSPSTRSSCLTLPEGMGGQKPVQQTIASNFMAPNDKLKSQSGIADLLLVTLCIATALGLVADSTLKNGGAFHYVHAIASAIYLVGFIVVVRRLYHDWSYYRQQPGVWILIVLGLGAISTLLFSTSYSLFIDESGDGKFGISEKFLIANLCFLGIGDVCCALVAFVSMRWVDSLNWANAPWRMFLFLLGIYFALSVLGNYLVSPFADDAMGGSLLYLNSWALQIASCLVWIALFWGVVVDVRSKTHRPFYHWLGVGFFLLSWLVIPLVTWIMAKLLTSEQMIGGQL